MDRRFFLASALGLGVLAAGRPASALQVASCGVEGGAPACRALAEHADLLRQVDAALAARGLSQPERTVVIAHLSCPTCGLPLAAAAGAF